MNTITLIQKRTSLVLKCIVVLSAVLGIILSFLSARDSFSGGIHIFMFFTIQSNIAIAVICAIGAGFLLNGRKIGKGWYIAKFVGTVSITLTGVVYAFVLAPTMGAGAWSLQNILTHLMVPVVSVIDFFVMSNVVRIKKINVLFVIIPPVAYAIYAGIAYVNGWWFAEGANYPYFFLNWGSKAGAFGFTNELPYMGTVWWILALLVFLIAVGLVYLVIADLIRKKTAVKK